MKRKLLYTSIIICVAIFSIDNMSAQSQNEKLSKPTIITPGKKGSAPSDAIILFDKDSLIHWMSVSTGGPAMWTVSGKAFTVKPGAKNIETRESFGNCQLHIEWRTPKKAVKEGLTGQENGNSGIYFMSMYEIQILNSYKNTTDPKGQAGAFYDNFPPLVNASRRPGKWQVYDIIFKAPEWGENEDLIRPGYFTVFHNGVLVQNNVEIKEPTASYNPDYSLLQKELPLMLQDHNNEVSFRNIWVRKLF